MSTLLQLQTQQTEKETGSLKGKKRLLNAEACTHIHAHTNRVVTIEILP